MGIRVFPNGSDPTIDTRITALENETIKRSYYQVVSGTSGSIPVSSGVTIVAGQFGSSGNAILSQVDGSGYPLDYSPTDGSGNPVTATLNVSTGAWTASATYTQLSAAIFFVATGTVKNISLFETAYPAYISIDDIGKEYVAGTGISIVTNVISSTSSATVSSVSGTTNRITVANGTTTPVVDISATFEALLGKVANPLSQFAATTSLQLKGVISDETGQGALVFAETPTLVTPILGVASATSLSLTGTAGAGFINLINQSSTPATPASGVSLYHATAGFSWVNSGGFTRSLTMPSANVVYTFPSATDTLAGLGTANSFTATQTFRDISPAANITYTIGSTGNAFQSIWTQTLNSSTSVDLTINAGGGAATSQASLILKGSNDSTTAGTRSTGNVSLTTGNQTGNAGTNNSGNIPLTTGNVTGTGTGVKISGSISLTTGNVSSSVAGSKSGDISLTPGTSIGTGVRGNVIITGSTDGSSAASGIIGEEIISTISTYANYTTTVTYQNITSITLTAGDWDIDAFATFSSNAATITAGGNAIFAIATTTASATGAVEGKSIAYVPQAALLGTSFESISIPGIKVSISSSTTYYFTTQAAFTIGNPQYVGTIRARRLR